MKSTEDEIRDNIMQYFYEMYKNRSGTFHGRERGDIAAANIRKNNNYDRAEVSRNLQYLSEKIIR